MRPIHRVLLVLASLLPCVAAGQARFTVTPANPASNDTVIVQKGFDNEDVTRTQIAMSGDKITVTLACGSGFPEPPPGLVSQPIGRFPAGSYQVEVVSDCGAAGANSLGVVPFTVAPRTPGQPIDDYSDIWWNPAESGWGLNIAQHGGGQLFATWFVYAADGSPTWYVVPGGHWIQASAFEGDIYRTTGPVVGATFDPAAVTRTKVGTADLVFGVNGQLIAIFTIDGKQVVKTLQRQSF